MPSTARSVTSRPEDIRWPTPQGQDESPNHSQESGVAQDSRGPETRPDMARAATKGGETSSAELMQSAAQTHTENSSAAKPDPQPQAASNFSAAAAAVETAELRDERPDAHEHDNDAQERPDEHEEGAQEAKSERGASGTAEQAEGIESRASEPVPGWQGVFVDESCSSSEEDSFPRKQDREAFQMKQASRRRRMKAAAWENM